MKTTQLILIIVGAVVLLLTIWWIFGTMRSFIKLKKRTKHAYKGLCGAVDVLYAFTDELLKKSGECGCDNEQLIKAKECALSAKKPEAKAECDAVLRCRIKKMLTDYCDKDNAAAFETEFAEIESEIFKERKIYNSLVREYNCKRKMFPDRIVGAVFRFKVYEFYTADEAEIE